MIAEKYIQFLIYLHAGLGGIALVAGLISISVKKGSSNHKKSGKVFFYAMLVSALTSLLIAILPNHENPFLFGIGLFSTYLILAGYRALGFKKANPNLNIDKILSGGMIITGLGMIFYPIWLTGSIVIVLAVFGSVGILMALRDFRLYREPKKLRENWLKLHLTKMLGGYIAATTAFVVVNAFFPSIYGWFVPGIIGGFYIAYWVRKLNKNVDVLNRKNVK